MIDSILFAVDVPAGTYAAGQELPMSVIRGPSVVRDGYGQAVLKQIVVLSSNNSITSGTYIDFRNANWNDSVKSLLSSVNGNQQYNMLAKTSPAIQKCGDIELQPNSSFNVKVVVGDAVTTTDDTSVFVLADIDYPSVAAVANPQDEKGQPMTIMRNDSVIITAHGDAENLVWTTVNVDEFKAGYRYLLAQCGAYTGGSALVGFVAFSGAPSMNGLTRIIPVIPRYAVSCRLALDYSTPLVKGPMDISYAMIGTAGTVAAVLECDYIRR